MATDLFRFQQHRANAKRRGIEFKLTFEEWIMIWRRSGHFDERGPHSQQYCMARFGDKGAYEVGNVVIKTNNANMLDHVPGNKYAEGNRAWLGRRHTEATKRKISKIKKGVPVHSDDEKVRMSVRMSGRNNPMYGRAGFGGRKHSPATLRKMRAAWKRRKEQRI